MGTVTEFIYFLNADKMPSEDEQDMVYTHLNITDEIKETRRQYRGMVKRSDEDQMELEL